MQFEILYHFSHGPTHLIETKRLDLSPDAGPGDIYQWMLIEDRTVRLLSFVSMSLVPQKRFFVEGSFEMNLQSCHGKLLGKDISLTRQDIVSESLRKLIEENLRTKGKLK